MTPAICPLNSDEARPLTLVVSDGARPKPRKVRADTPHGARRRRGDHHARVDDGERALQQLLADENPVAAARVAFELGERLTSSERRSECMALWRLARHSDSPVIVARATFNLGVALADAGYEDRAVSAWRCAASMSDPVAAANAKLGLASYELTNARPRRARRARASLERLASDRTQPDVANRAAQALVESARRQHPAAVTAPSSSTQPE